MSDIRVYRRDGVAPTADEILAAGHAVAAYRSKTSGVFPFKHNGIEVEYHPHKRIAYVQGNESIYFGYGGYVDMRCQCKKVLLKEWHFDHNGQNGRASAFVSSGTELAGADISSDENYYYNALFGSPWWGGSLEALTNRGLIAGNLGGYQNGNFLTFTVPEDACYPINLGGEVLMNAVQISGSTIVLEKIVHVTSSDINPNVYEHNGLYYRSSASTELTEDKILQVNNYLDTVVIPGKNESLIRENNRRKKCSDGQQTLLRSGFLPVEFEFFIKSQHPKSAKIRPEIPMQVVTDINFVNTSMVVGDESITYTYTGSATLKYSVEDVNGNSIDREEVIEGTATLIQYLTKVQNEYSYVNFPIGNTVSGTSQYPSGFPNNVRIPFTSTPSYTYEENTYISDKSSTQAMFSILNGSAIASSWEPTFDLLSAKSGFDINFFPNDIGVEVSVNNIIKSHPQFITDYISASKPIEFEVINGEKVAVTPSTDWLTSAMIDKEIVRIVPLNFVGINNLNYGMFPLGTVDDNGESIISKLRIYGFAEFQYNAATASFNFIKWVELVEGGKTTLKFDDEFEFNDENEPTSITINSSGVSTTYNLSPKEFDYDSRWSNRNCVCITNKVMWTDVKGTAKTQSNNISDSPPQGYELTDEERLYAEVRKAIK